MCKECLQWSVGKKVRWWFYNFAFGVFGKSRLWPRMEFAIWK